eukprot:691266-Pyramimonas_sp.AAC.1
MAACSGKVDMAARISAAAHRVSILTTGGPPQAPRLNHAARDMAQRGARSREARAACPTRATGEGRMGQEGGREQHWATYPKVDIARLE